MKKALPVALALLAFIAAGSTTSAQSAPVSDSVTMGPGYANEVYYSMSTGTVAAFPRNSWDIAFRTRIMSSSILINEGTGVLLYTYPKSDTSGWASVDTTGLFTWKPMYNDPKDWENGAFSRNATGGLDFGWGIYNVTTHDLTGDSIFIIKTGSGFKKIWILRKRSVENIYDFRFANLDGSNDQTVDLDCNPYKDMDFIGYSLANNQAVTIQPSITSWDLLFTKYVYVYPDGTPYIVTGVLNNDSVYTQTFEHVPLSFTGYNPDTWDTTRSGIGWQWKTFTGTNYVIVDSLVYFVKSRPGLVYSLVFTKFEGGTTGKIGFTRTRMIGLGISENNQPDTRVIVYPNPARERINVSIPQGLIEAAGITITDLSGRRVYTGQINGNTGTGAIDVTEFAPGIYFLRVTEGSSSTVKKFIVSR